MMVAAGRLPSSQRVRIRVARGKTSVIGGPFAQTKELVGGFAIFDLKSKEEAIESGRRFMQIHADILGPSYEGESEIRRMFDAKQPCPKVTGWCERRFRFPASGQAHAQRLILLTSGKTNY